MIINLFMLTFKCRYKDLFQEYHGTFLANTDTSTGCETLQYMSQVPVVVEHAALLVLSHPYPRFLSGINTFKVRD